MDGLLFMKSVLSTFRGPPGPPVYYKFVLTFEPEPAMFYPSLSVSSVFHQTYRRVRLSLEKATPEGVVKPTDIADSQDDMIWNALQHYDHTEYNKYNEDIDSEYEPPEGMYKLESSIYTTQNQIDGVNNHAFIPRQFMEPKRMLIWIRMYLKHEVPLNTIPAGLHM